MRRWLGLALLLACKKETPATAVAPAPSASTDRTTFDLETPAFLPSAAIPVEFTCDGADKSPELEWIKRPAPPLTKSFTLIVDDPDAPSGTFAHWVHFDIEPPTNTLPAGAKGVGIEGKNDFGKLGWGGPCPPKGPAHRYFFRLVALDVASLHLKEGATRAEVDAAMKGHVLAKAETMGTYQRK